MVMDSLEVAVCARLPESVTVTVKSEVPLAVGVPEMMRPATTAAANHNVFATASRADRRLRAT